MFHVTIEQLWVSPLQGRFLADPSSYTTTTTLLTKQQQKHDNFHLPQYNIFIDNIITGHKQKQIISKLNRVIKFTVKTWH